MTERMSACKKGPVVAKNIMTREVISVSEDTPVLEAIRLMVDNKITGVPVVEDDMVLVGMLSECDVLRLFHTYGDEGNRTVGDFMTQPAVHFEEDERLLDVCFHLRDHSIRRVPVTSNGKVTGVISRSDILRYILQLSEQSAVRTAGKSG